MNINDFDLSIVYTRKDGSYVVNKGMYHVPNEGEWKDLWSAVHQYARMHPDAVCPEPEDVAVSMQEILAMLENSVQTILDNKAIERGYDNIVSACSYAASTNSTYASDALYFTRLRDKAWEYAYAELDKIRRGRRGIPGYSEFADEVFTQASAQ